MNSEFVLEQLALGKRIDGRDPLQQRMIQCHFGPQSTGAIELSLGETRVFATTSASITTPNPIRPSEGFLKFHLDLQVLRDTGYMHNPIKLGMEIEKYIEKVIKGSKALDTESLCILSGKNVWSIDVNVALINNDGNLLDAMYLCCIFSLQHFRRPQVSVSLQGVKLEIEKRLVPLSIHHIPLSLTYAILELNEQTILLQDPCLEEEAVQNGRITYSVNIYNDICHVHKPGGSPINISILQQLTTVTLMKSRPYTEEIRNLLINNKGFPIEKTVTLFKFELPKQANDAIQVEQLEQLYNQ
ncbi:unnamed protein product [Paramecium pentaurelia]|uniref:Exoribonuclease phosphorolytic domain-containing protein n=1 Tax=Paramecium pentaurelia TaxID=43138 RepID=A0A8S1XJA3_9CILI|nr:unnamed protein product [Paramecium pentaurelia]